MHWVLSWFRNCSPLASHFLTTASYFVSFSLPYFHMVALLLKIFLKYPHMMVLYTFIVSKFGWPPSKPSCVFTWSWSALFSIPLNNCSKTSKLTQVFPPNNCWFHSQQMTCLYIGGKNEVIIEVSLNFSVNISIFFGFYFLSFNLEICNVPYQFKANPCRWLNSISPSFGPVLAL